LALWLVVLGRVELQFSEEFAIVGKDADVSIVDQDEDVAAGVASADADVVEPAVVPQVKTPLGSILSWRMRWWVSSRGRPVGTAFGRAW
jgi:hypothetical protein